MANVRYYSEFRTLKGDFYLIEIYDSTFTGDESRVYTDSSGFTLTHDGETDQVFSPIIGSSVQFNVYNQDSAFDTFLNDILTQQDKRFFVKIYRSKHEATDDLNAFYNTTKVVKDGLVMFSTDPAVSQTDLQQNQSPHALPILHCPSHLSTRESCCAPNPLCDQLAVLFARYHHVSRF